MTANEVVVAGATFRYAHDGQPALRGLDLRAGGGKLVLLLGASGCGKTTATRLLNGLVPHFFEGGALDGSVDVCGMEPCPPLPVSSMVKQSNALMAVPRLNATVPVGSMGCM